MKAYAQPGMARLKLRVPRAFGSVLLPVGSGNVRKLTDVLRIGRIQSRGPHVFPLDCFVDFLAMHRDF